EDTPHRIRDQKLSDALATYALVARQTSDQRGWDAGVIAGKLAGELFRQIFEAQLESAQAVEAHDAQVLVHRDEYAGHVATFVLPGPMPEPVVQFSLPTRELRAVVLLTESFENDGQPSAHQITMAAEGCDELVRGLRRVHQRFKEGLSIRAGQDHAFMLVQHAARTLIGEVTRRQA